jgi:hypothetical protein
LAVEATHRAEVRRLHSEVQRLEVAAAQALSASETALDALTAECAQAVDALAVQTAAAAHALQAADGRAAEGEAQHALDLEALRKELSASSGEASHAAAAAAEQAMAAHAEAALTALAAVQTEERQRFEAATAIGAATERRLQV